MDKDYEEEEMKKEEGKEQNTEEISVVNDLNRDARDDDFLNLRDLLRLQFHTPKSDYSDSVVIYNGRYGLHNTNLLAPAFLLCIKKGLAKLNIVNAKEYLKKNAYLSILKLKKTIEKRSVLLQIYLADKIYLINGVGFKDNGAKSFEDNPTSCLFLHSISSGTIPEEDTKKEPNGYINVADELKEFRRIQLQEHQEMLREAKRLKLNDLEFFPVALLKKLMYFDE